ncbi:MAG: hypothetical protein ACRDS0_35610 [Pseudonocardiaceae bacterium]
MRIPWSGGKSSTRSGRGSPPGGRRKWRLLLVPAMGIAVVCQLSLTGPAGAATAAATAKTAASGGVAPKATNELDCNGWSKAYGTVRKLAGSTCVDPVKVDKDGDRYRFEDNGHYIGHDEPSVKFISSTPGSGNTMTYLTKIPVDPHQSPTPSGSVTNYGQLSVAPWFGLPMCDPKSYPQNACTPDSDTNTGGNAPTDAGSAFMELQLYPPGYTPFVDSESCSATKWCAALNIDSLECTFGFATCNNDCIEPVNFSYLQTNGVPPAPPSPQLTNVHTFLPNAHTLMINPGDTLAVSISDPPQGFTTTIRDLTTHQTGTMTASAANGFMNTNIADCTGTPFTFHAEYSTAKQQNQVPWAALEGGVLMQQEIGHSEVCNSVKNQDPFTFSTTYSDPKVFDTCMGGSEGPGQTGEGPCDPTTGICQNASTEGPKGPVACPTNDSTSGANCEFADGNCFQKGTRPVTIDGVPATESSDANQCFDNRYQNGDLDFDGLSYQASAWPNGTRNHPTAFEYAGPFQASGRPYPQIQFETNVGASEILCDTATGSGCTVPPQGSNFYPFWSLSLHPASFASQRTGCAWNFGNVLPNTFKTFGKDAQYGTPNVARFAGTSTSPVQANPQFAGACRFL